MPTANYRALQSTIRVLGTEDYSPPFAAKVAIADITGLMMKLSKSSQTIPDGVNLAFAALVNTIGEPTEVIAELLERARTQLMSVPAEAVH